MEHRKYIIKLSDGSYVFEHELLGFETTDDFDNASLFTEAGLKASLKLFPDGELVNNLSVSSIIEVDIVVVDGISIQDFKKTINHF